MKHIKLFEDFSNNGWYIIGGIAITLLYKILKNVLIPIIKNWNRPDDYYHKEWKEKLHTIIEMGRGVYIKAKDEKDFINISIEGKGVDKFNIKLFKDKPSFQFNELTVPLTQEEYDKLYNSIYFYIR